MFIVISLMFLGIAAGYCLRNLFSFTYISKTIMITIYLLLFFLGLDIGLNENIINNLSTLGAQALIISMAATLGTALAALFVFKFFFRKERQWLSGSADNNATESNNENNNTSDENKLSGKGNVFKMLQGSFVIVAFCILGIIIGVADILPDSISGGDIATWVLYMLMIQVGLSIGSDKKLKEIIKSVSPKMIVLPVATMLGTIIFSALASLVISKWSMADCLAVGCGFGYYSLSSILIADLKTLSYGAQMAAELGTVALIANVIREMVVLLFSPLLYKVFGVFAPICVAGATGMDTSLPIITKVCGKHLAFISIFHAVIVDFSVPLWVSFFAG